MRGSRATIGRDLGRMFQALGGMLVVSTLIPILWAEYYAIPAMVVSAAIPFGVGTLLTARFGAADNPG
ncbi:potassium transporter Trk, partial [Halobacteriales archaeon QS_9_67_17]